MKIKSGILILSSFLLTALSACGTDIQRNLAPAQLPVQVQNNVVKNDLQMQSDEGLFEFITATQKALFKAYDKNKDSFITKDELNGIIQDEFASIDLDRNGKITLREANKSFFFFQREIGSRIFRDLETQLFEKYLDKDNDALLSRDEFLSFYLSNTTDAKRIKYFKTAFTKNDINKDGSLNFSEYEDTMYQMFRRDIKVEIRDNGYTIIFG